MEWLWRAISHRKRPAGPGGNGLRRVLRALGGGGAREPLLAAVQTLFKDAAGRLPFTRVTTLEGNLAESVRRERLLAGFAAFALLIAATGVAGLLSYTVHQRRKEIGIRLALGAPPGRIRGQFQRYGLALSAAGIGLGGLLSFALRRAMDSFLFQVTPADPGVWLAVAALLLASAGAAAAIPAWRAARIHPSETLRLE